MRRGPRRAIRAVTQCDHVVRMDVEGAPQTALRDRGDAQLRGAAIDGARDESRQKHETSRGRDAAKELIGDHASGAVTMYEHHLGKHEAAKTVDANITHQHLRLEPSAAATTIPSILVVTPGRDF